MQDHRAALGETGEDDPLGGDALGALFIDEGDDLVGGGVQLVFVDGPRRTEGKDVVPARHDPAAIDRHRLARRLGEDEAGARQDHLQGFGHRLEVGTVGAQAVQPDDAGVGIRGIEDQGFAHNGSRQGAYAFGMGGPFDNRRFPARKSARLSQIMHSPISRGCALLREVRRARRSSPAAVAPPAAPAGAAALAVTVRRPAREATGAGPAVHPGAAKGVANR